MKTFETIIIGGGQAGLAASYYLKRHGHDHIVLEQAVEAANAWRNHRWDSFTLNTPNWQSQLAGAGLPGADPDAFVSRDELVSYFGNYIRANQLPIWYGARVLSVRQEAGRYTVETTEGTFHAKNVVVATGLYQTPRIPRFKGALSPEIRQLHSDGYRNPGSLPSGAVLVVGSAQSGAQIAEELYQSGTQVYLSVSRSGRVPRRYRDKDINWWSNELGLYERTVDELKSPRDKFGGKPHISGTMGGHTINLHRFAADGVTLIGRVAELGGDRIELAHDLHSNLAAADQFEANLTAKIDIYIDEHRMEIPEETLPRCTAGFEQEERDELDLAQSGIQTVIWATGYAFDFSMVRLPVFDADGYPIQRRGVTDYRGLYFAGLPWLHTAKSGLIFGVSEDAEYIVSQIVNQTEHAFPHWQAAARQGVSYEF